MVESSALSSLSRTPTPCSRYQTADESASVPADLGDVTDISSPGEAADHDFGSLKAPYREAKALPEELKARCQIQLEEQTYEPALHLLTSLLCDGISHANASKKPGSIPPPGQLSLLATLAIHPKETSKLTDLASHEVASLSLSYLRNVLATVGPVNGRLREAFVFRGDKKRRRRSSDDFRHNDSGSEEEHIRGKMAGKSSVWQGGEEFWKVLGWSFNCSALYPHRWRWWKPWLEYLVDVLEDDYGERTRLDEENAGGSQPCDYSLLRDSLLVSYIAPRSSRSSPARPIMNALFADGSSSSALIFKEVFRNETKVASKSNKKRKRGLDLEKDDFGDYADDSSSGGSQPPTPEHQRTNARKVDDAVPWTSSALMETIPLRLRLFALLSRAVDDVPDACHIKVSDLYQIFVEKMAFLPLPAFTQFIFSLQNHLDRETVVAIIRVLMPHLVPPQAPNPRTVDRAAADHDAVSPLIFEKCYLPFAYKTAENNTKLSLAIEILFRILRSSECLTWTPSLQEAVRKGIKARRDKSASKKSNDGQNATRDALCASGSRLLALAELLKMQEQRDDAMQDA
ncbi:unnamed protein product [Discula destructiva]